MIIYCLLIQQFESNFRTIIIVRIKKIIFIFYILYNINLNYLVVNQNI